MKNIILAILLCYLSGSGIIYSQPNNEKFNHSGIISLKGGWHSSDNYLPYPTIGDYNLPGGVDATACGEVPLGRGVFLGFLCDVWFGNDEPFDSFHSLTAKRNFFAFTFDPVVRWRYQIKKIILGVGLGIGETTLNVKYPNYNEASRLFNLTSQILCDFFLGKEIALSSEISYFGMAKIDMGGGGRSNKIFQFKLGLSWYANLYK